MVMPQTISVIPLKAVCWLAFWHVATPPASLMPNDCAAPAQPWITGELPSAVTVEAASARCTTVPLLRWQCSTS
ncbi:hypothetical protein D9M69_561080 [compost metagenome]